MASTSHGVKAGSPFAVTRKLTSRASKGKGSWNPCCKAKIVGSRGQGKKLRKQSILALSKVEGIIFAE